MHFKKAMGDEKWTHLGMLDLKFGKGDEVFLKVIYSPRLEVFQF